MEITPSGDEKATTEIIETENNNQVEMTEEDMESEELEGESSGEEGDENEDDDSEGWITPGNIQKVKEEMGWDDEVAMEETDVKCACLTTDFAMQVGSIL